MNKNNRKPVLVLCLLLIGLFVISACDSVVGRSNELEKESFSIVYFKNCNYVWDSSNHIGESVIIAAGVEDVSGSTDGDSVEVEVVENTLGGSGGAYPMDGSILDIQIIEPGSGEVSGDVEIIINSKGPVELDRMSLGFSGDGWGSAFPMHDGYCVSGVLGRDNN